MKFGTTIAAFESGFGPIVFTGNDIKANLKKIKELGYDGIDLFAGEKSNADLGEIYNLISNNNLEVACYIPIHLAEKGYSLSHPDNEKRKMAVYEYQKQIICAEKVRSNAMPIGLLRGNRIHNEDEEAYEARLAESLHQLANDASERNITLCLEPINRYEINTFQRTEQALSFIERFNLDKVMLLLDTFHMNIEEQFIEGAIKQAYGRIGHVHIADSNRLYPSAGHLDFDKILSALKSIDYSGYLTVEVFPNPYPHESAQKAIKFLKDKI